MTDTLTLWPAWLGGVAIGTFLTLLLWATGKVLGVSSAYGEACGLLGSDYFRDPARGYGRSWRLFFVAGLPLGGAFAHLSAGLPWRPSWDMGALYERALPAALAPRLALLLLGGVLIGVGARMAGGCQSGHAIAGVALRNPPSLLAGAGFFVGGVVAVQALFAVAGS
jgi:uncharacterized membrane protein YedE/YeeE